MRRTISLLEATVLSGTFGGVRDCWKQRIIKMMAGESEYA
jgi:hypothetical protein